MPTCTPKAGDTTRSWYVIDATDVVLGRLAVEAAKLLRGKHKPTFTPNVDGGDFVVVINADKVAISGDKLPKKFAYAPLGFPRRSAPAHPRRGAGEARRPGSWRRRSSACCRTPSSAVRSRRSLKVYAGPDHPHTAQKPVPFEIKQVAQ